MIKKINQAASILGLVLCAVLAYVFWKAGLFDSKEALTSCISRFGWAGPAVFITFQAVQVVIPILPGGQLQLRVIAVVGIAHVYGDNLFIQAPSPHGAVRCPHSCPGLHRVHPSRTCCRSS